jgi:hypothetical protein
MARRFLVVVYAGEGERLPLGDVEVLDRPSKDSLSSESRYGVPKNARSRPVTRFPAHARNAILEIGICGRFGKSRKPSGMALVIAIRAAQPETCGRPVRLGGQPSRPAARLRQAGQDAYLLLTMLERNQRPGGPGSDGLHRIFLQDFLIADGKARAAHRGGRPAAGEPAHYLSLRSAGPLRDARRYPLGRVPDPRHRGPVTRARLTWFPTWPPLSPPSRTMRRSRLSTPGSPGAACCPPGTWLTAATSRSATCTPPRASRSP